MKGLCDEQAVEWVPMVRRQSEGHKTPIVIAHQFETIRTIGEGVAEFE